MRCKECGRETEFGNICQACADLINDEEKESRDDE